MPELPYSEIAPVDNDADVAKAQQRSCPATSQTTCLPSKARMIERSDPSRIVVLDQKHRVVDGTDVSQCALRHLAKITPT